MNKTLKEQLATLAPSLGFDVKKESKEEAKSYILRKNLISKVYEAPVDKKMQNIIKLANSGRRGEQLRVKKSIDISAFLNFIRDCKCKGVISDIDEYFCLCAVKNIDEFSSFEIQQFQKTFRDIEAKMTELINLKKVDAKDIARFGRQIEITKIREDNLRKQKELENYLFLSKKVLFSGIDIDAKISSTPLLDENDFQLAIEWLKNDLKKVINNNINIVLESYGDDYEVGRVLSARAAEIAAKTFYKRCGFNVEDVSTKQIKQNNDNEWRYYDLKVNDCPVDIKNSRRSLSSPDRYVEHCIPQKGKITRNKEKVKLAGILSSYLWPKTLLAPEEYKNLDTSLIFLGETTYDEHVQLKNEFCSEYFDIDFSRPDRDTKFFLPPWIFNYPTKIYGNRSRAIDKLSMQSTPDYNLCQQKKFNFIPASLASKNNLSEYYPPDALKKWEWDLYNKLFNRIQVHGLSLPLIYLSFVSHFAEMISKHGDQCKDYRPYQYRSFVFMNKDEFNKPLGIYDPLYTIRSLIKVLDDLWSANHDLIRMYKFFKLSGFHIFQGRSMPHENWETLVAYCGGRIEGKGKCGNYPLVLGESARCEKCKKLICPICGFCSEGCEKHEVKIVQNDSHRIEGKYRSIHEEIPF